MGLEFGHDLFMANYPVLDGITKSVLSTAYQHLNRNNFKKILELQWEHGRRQNE